MPLEEIITRSITGIRPFNELPIDAEIWREAHNHHSLHRHLHAVAAHRPGIVFGLEVVASKVTERTIVVAPGVAIDSNGQTIVLEQPVSFTIEEPRQIYIVLSFLRAADRNSAVTVGGGQQFYREVEGRDLKQTKELPATPYLELARIFRSGPEKPIRDAAKAFTPASDEINLLYRPIAFPHCFADIGVGELSYVPKTGASAWNPNRAGLWNLVREGNGCGFHLAFTGPLNLRAPSFGPADPALVYVAGAQGFQPLADAEVDGVRRYLDSGGLLFAESCGGEEFTNSFLELAGKLGADLKDVAAGHPLLMSHHVFSAPPGGPKGRLQADLNAGVIFGDRNYGGAWQGDVPDPGAVDARERIRQAQEFGLNVVALAAQRRRVRELSGMG
ncbi:hypothetical protein CCAX7_63140 [Capsulimonas corticalis]|uniref:Uncharacterized protein n=1 Tax=Capsulimonas corticalis TaxID=2219043 RepID=A0A402CWV8_9BACT|nr:DUF4159 domain-containing protein [Capsulimonas corticalis]BDI34263.1 hypothetical protein CCAX7_63140 [Capsulimonas corticalis]